MTLLHKKTTLSKANPTSYAIDQKIKTPPELDSAHLLNAARMAEFGLHLGGVKSVNTVVSLDQPLLKMPPIAYNVMRDQTEASNVHALKADEFSLYLRGIKSVDTKQHPTQCAIPPIAYNVRQDQTEASNVHTLKTDEFSLYLRGIKSADTVPTVATKQPPTQCEISPMAYNSRRAQTNVSTLKTDEFSLYLMGIKSVDTAPVVSLSNPLIQRMVKPIAYNVQRAQNLAKSQGKSDDITCRRKEQLNILTPTSKTNNIAPLTDSKKPILSVDNKRLVPVKNYCRVRQHTRFPRTCIVVESWILLLLKK